MNTTIGISKSVAGHIPTSAITTKNVAVTDKSTNTIAAT